jgi:hypothetical protein
LPRFFFQQVSVFVGNFDGELSINSCALSNTGAECANSGKQSVAPEETGGARDRRIDHRQHAIGVRAHLFALDWIRQIRLATSY